jgi:hypothetical protein
MHIIPWSLLSRAVRGAASENDTEAEVRISNRLFRLLVEAALSNAPFDERSYVGANPDIADAIRRGKVASGRQHYLSSGYYEGRDTGPAGFDEAWYLQRYPDVQLAVQRGESASGLEHYRGPGMREWRSPNRAAEADIARWRKAISGGQPAEDADDVAQAARVQVRTKTATPGKRRVAAA